MTTSWLRWWRSQGAHAALAAAQTYKRNGQESDVQALGDHEMKVLRTPRGENKEKNWIAALDCKRADWPDLCTVIPFTAPDSWGVALKGLLVGCSGEKRGPEHLVDFQMYSSLTSSKVQLGKTQVTPRWQEACIDKLALINSNIIRQKQGWMTWKEYSDTLWVLRVIGKQKSEKANLTPTLKEGWKEGLVTSRSPLPWFLIGVFVMKKILLENISKHLIDSRPTELHVCDLMCESLASRSVSFPAVPVV